MNKFFFFFDEIFYCLIKRKENSDKSSESSGNNQSGNQTNDSCEYEEHLVSNLNELQRFNLKHRELYFSKFTDTIAATTIRAKCMVLLFNEEVEKYSDYALKEVAL